MRRWVLSFLGSVLYVAGILLELSLSGGIMWGELESRVYTTQLGGFDLSLKCPHMLSTAEKGTVRTEINNPLDEPATPVVTAIISGVSGEQRIIQSMLLSPHETRSAQWSVDSSDMLFGRLLLVSIVQGRYGDLPMRQGTCGILFLDLFGLSGTEAFYLLSSGSLTCIVLGAALWRRSHWPLNESDTSFARACGTAAFMATTGLLVALPRWWGVVLLIDILTLIVMVVVLTEFVLFPGRLKA